MDTIENFTKEMKEGYTYTGASITLGASLLNGTCISDAPVNIPLKMFNRHGLIAGATGTGKTKTLQNIAGALSKQGVPTLLMDIKGDLSGIAKLGESNPHIEERHKKIDLPFQPSAHPVEFLTLSDEKGTPLRATVTEFGPVLLSKILGLNDTQGGILAILFQYCDENQIPLLDLKDLKKTLQHISGGGKNEIEQEYGKISKSSTGTILRKIVALEQQGAEKLFGEKSFEVADLLSTSDQMGIISILRLTDIQEKPHIFSTFMLQLLAEIYSSFPEVDDLEKPKLVLFIDEAHLIFEEASKPLLKQVETMIKLIRSKGVGIFFCTQTPTDIPKAILGQLGLKIQHALRAFTAADRKAIKLVAQNYPTSEYYKTDELLTKLGIGEAFISALNEKGTPTPLVVALLSAPSSRMGPLTDSELDQIVKSSSLVKKYSEKIDSRSAYEILSEKISVAEEKPKKKEEKSLIETFFSSTVTRQVGRTIAREVTRASSAS